MYRNSIKEVAVLTDTDLNHGLSQQEAEKRWRREGANELVEKKQESPIKIFLEQFKDPMVVILIVGAALSVLLGEGMDACIILFVIIMNAFIGTGQVMKSEKALAALKQLIHPTCKVIRDGVLTEINSSECVVGDLIEFEAGDCIPCDIRLISTTRLKLDESLLTGESEPTEKNEYYVADGVQGVADQRNMAFMSTYVTSGRGRGIAVHCGMDSEVGKIASLLNKENNEMTPMQRRLAEMGKLLGILSVVLCAIMFGVGVIQGKNIFDMLLLAISLAVAAIPEGLPAVVTIVQAMGVTAMSAQNAIVRKLHAVETLGSVSVICSDKTGTLTQNKMHVVSTYENRSFDEPVSKEFLTICALCNHVETRGDSLLGDPSEKALVEFAKQQGVSKQVLECSQIRIDEIPFDSNRKKMSTVHEVDQKKMVYSKGAVDRILKQCNTLLVNGQKVAMSNYDRKCIMEASKTMGQKALRVFAFAMKTAHSLHEESIEKDCTFVGLAGLMDPPREEVKEAIETCRKAQIKVVMITGDSPITAYAIAHQLELVTHEEDVMSGDEIEVLNDEQLLKACKRVKIFARVSPEHKVRLVECFKKNGGIVAMSGDGVNDAPALKCADIGIAMGENGSDVCKSASDILLTDDNFKTIVKAVEAGRNIYLKIQKAVYYLLSCNLGEIMTLFLAVLLLPHGVPALCAIQILWVNLVTDAFPALALGVEPDDPQVMTHQPRNPKESLFAHGGYAFVICNGLYIGTISLVAFKYGLAHSSVMAQTMAFMVLSISQLFHAMNCRNDKESMFKIGFFKNKWLILTIGVGLALQVFVCHFPPMNVLLKTMPLSLKEWIIVLALSASTMVINEVSKLFNH